MLANSCHSPCSQRQSNTHAIFHEFPTQKHRAQTSSRHSAPTSSHCLREGAPSGPPNRHDGMRVEAGWRPQSGEAEQHPEQNQPSWKSLGRMQREDLTAQRQPWVLEASTNSPTWWGLAGARNLVPSGSATSESEGQTQDLKEAKGKIHVTTFITQQRNFPDEPSGTGLALLEAISWLFKGRLFWVPLKTRGIAIRGKEIKSTLISSISGASHLPNLRMFPMCCFLSLPASPRAWRPGSLGLGKWKCGFTYAGLYLWDAREDNTMAQSFPTTMAAKGNSKFIIGIPVAAFFKRGIKTLKSIQEHCLCNLRREALGTGACARRLPSCSQERFPRRSSGRLAPWLLALRKASPVQEAGIAGLPAWGSPLYTRLLQMKAALTGARCREKREQRPCFLLHSQPGQGVLPSEPLRFKVDFAQREWVYWKVLRLRGILGPGRIKLL